MESSTVFVFVTVQVLTQNIHLMKQPMMKYWTNNIPTSNRRNIDYKMWVKNGRNGEALKLVLSLKWDYFIIP